ncbi:MAG: S41 family peptidase [Candidatus Margulisiibacteriota bacterium]
MKKRSIILSLIFIMLTQVLVFAQQEANFNVLLEVYGLVKTQYVEHVTEDQKLVYGAVRGMLESLEDPYTRFLEPTANSEMKVRLEGEFHGVGIQIGIKNKQLTVIAPIDDTPGFRAGIKAKDQIIAIDGKSTAGISLTEAVSKIRGPKGEKVVLGIRRPTVTPPVEMDISIIRDTIKLKSISGTEVVTDNVGYVRIVTFESKQMMDELQDALKTLNKQKIKGLIVDVRDNGGGLLFNAINASSIFLENAEPIVHTIGRDHIFDTQVAINIRPKFKKPLIVLVNGNSASASEIFAGAISDNGRGLVMGSKTFGKASVQNVRELSDASAVLVTVAKYLTPHETDITKVGIEPDVVVAIPTDNIELMSSANYIYDQKDDVVLQESIKMMREIIQ